MENLLEIAAASLRRGNLGSASALQTAGNKLTGSAMDILKGNLDADVGCGGICVPISKGARVTTLFDPCGKMSESFNNGFEALGKAGALGTIAAAGAAVAAGLDADAGKAGSTDKADASAKTEDMAKPPEALADGDCNCLLRLFDDENPIAADSSIALEVETFKTEFSTKKTACAVLIIKEAINTWNVYGYNDREKWVEIKPTRSTSLITELRKAKRDRNIDTIKIHALTDIDHTRPECLTNANRLNKSSKTASNKSNSASNAGTWLNAAKNAVRI